MPFYGPLALLKEPPRAGSAVPDSERIQREVESGFTGVSLAAADTQQDARNAALTASAVCQMELGLEIVPLGGARAAAELARQLRSRGAPPSAVRITGMEDDAETLSAELGHVRHGRFHQLVAGELSVGVHEGRHRIYTIVR